jgi:TolB protein
MIHGGVKMKTYRILLVVLTLVMLLAQCALCASIWTEEKITSAGTWGRSGPVVWGDKVYWNDQRSGKNEIYVWDRVGGERCLLSGSASTAVWSAYQGTLVTGHYVNGQYDLYVWDASNGERAISTAPGNQTYASTCGNTVVWQDTRSGVSQVYMWDPINGERQIAPSGYAQTRPKIWGNTVVWEEGYTDEWTGYQASVYMWSPTAGKVLVGDGMRSPAIYGDKITMFLPDPDPYSDGSRLYQYAISTGTISGYATVGGRSIFSASMWGDTVVWYTGGTYADVGAWDPIHGVTYVNHSNLGHAYTPSIYGRYVAWSNGKDIYLSTIVPEPSACVGLMLGLVGIMPCLRRRRTER